MTCTASCCARSTIDLRFFADTPWAISAAYLLFVIIKISSSWKTTTKTTENRVKRSFYISIDTFTRVMWGCLTEMSLQRQLLRPRIFKPYSSFWESWLEIHILILKFFNYYSGGNYRGPNPDSMQTWYAIKESWCWILINNSTSCCHTCPPFIGYNSIPFY